MAPKIPLPPGDHLYPVQPAAAAADAGVDGDAGIPPPQVPDGLLDAADVPLRWGVWVDAHHVDALPEDPVVDGHIVHDLAAVGPAAADLADGDEADPLDFLHGGGGDDPYHFGPYDSGDGDDPYHFGPYDSGDGDDPYHFGPYDSGDWDDDVDRQQQPDGDAFSVHISGMDDLAEIMRDPPQSSMRSFVIVSCTFGTAEDFLRQIDIISDEQGWEWVGNYAQLMEASQLKETLRKLDCDLNRFATLLQDSQFDRELVHSLSSYLPQLAEHRTGLQPMNLRYYCDAILNALKVLIEAFPGDTAPLDWVASIPGRIDCDRIKDCLKYILERIHSLDEVDIHYSDDVLPPDMPGGQSWLPGILEDHAEEVEEAEDELQEGEHDYVPLYDVRLMLMPEEEQKVPALDSSLDLHYHRSDEYSDTPLQIVRIRDFISLSSINSAVHKYYIIESFLFGEAWDLLHGIRERSEKCGWLWVGNMDRLWQAHNLRDTFALLSHELNQVSSLMEDGQVNRVGATLSDFIECLPFASTCLQPPNIRYLTDAIAIELQSLVASICDEPVDSSSADPAAGINNLPEGPGVDARIEAILHMIRAIDNESVYYPRDVTLPEILPALPGPPPVPLP